MLLLFSCNSNKDFDTFCKAFVDVEKSNLEGADKAYALATNLSKQKNKFSSTFLEGAGSSPLEFYPEFKRWTESQGVKFDCLAYDEYYRPLIDEEKKRLKEQFRKICKVFKYSDSSNIVGNLNKVNSMPSQVISGMISQGVGHEEQRKYLYDSAKEKGIELECPEFEVFYEQ